MAWYRCGGGEIKEGGSVILAPNPTITLTPNGSNVTITWSKPSSEVSIAKYIVYRSTSQSPTSLNQMNKVGETTNLKYEDSNLTSDIDYYYVVTTVTSNGYENASVKTKKSISIASSAYIICTNYKVFASNDLVNWTNITDSLGLFSVSGNKIAYCTNAKTFYTSDDVHVSTNGIDWVSKPLSVSTPSGIEYPESIGYGRHDMYPIFYMNNSVYFLINGKYTELYRDGPGKPAALGYWFSAGSARWVTSSSVNSSYIYTGDQLYGAPVSVCSESYVTYIVTVGDMAETFRCYKQEVNVERGYKIVLSRSGSAGQYAVYGLSVAFGKGTNDKDIIVLTTASCIFYSLDSGSSWVEVNSDYNLPSDIIASKVTYDSVYNRFVFMEKSACIYTVNISDVSTLSSSSPKINRINLNSKISSTTEYITSILAK